VTENLFPLVWTGLGSVLAGAFIAVLLCRLLLRRDSGAPLRELVSAIDDLAEGRPERIPSAVDGEPFAPALSALAALAQALKRRDLEEERRAAGLRSLLDGAAGTGFVATDSQGDVLLWSAGARQITGFPVEEVRGRPLERLFPPESWSQIRVRLGRQSSPGEAGETLSASLCTRDGGTLPVFLQIGPPASGANGGCCLSFRDRSEAERLDRTLRQSEERYRRMIEGVADGAFLARDGHVVQATRALEELLGASPGALDGQPVRDWIASEDLLRAGDDLARAAAGVRIEQEVRLRPLSGGEAIPARWTLDQVRLGDEPAVVGTVRQASGLQAAIEKLAHDATLLDATVESTPDGVLLFAGEPGQRRVRVANARLQDLLGIDPRDAAHRSERELGVVIGARLEDAGEFESFFEALAADTDRADRRTFGRRGDPEGRLVEARSVPARDGAGRSVGRVWLFRDVTAAAALARSRDALEDSCHRLEELNRHLSTRSTELDALNAELRSLDRMKSDLLANVSHELQTPLTAIKGYTELILKGKLGAVTGEQRRGLEVAQRNADRLIVMIENLLSLARTEKDMPAMRVVTFPLWDLIEECIELLRETADRKHLSLATRYLTEDLHIRGDREKISQVFLNLLSNAIKFSTEAGEITITVRKGKRGFLIVEVRDTGVGIPAEDLEKIFDRFYRAHEEAGGDPASGTGIGLTIVRDILRLHGCTIRADSRPGEGAVFTLTLPQAEAVVPDDQTEKGSQGVVALGETDDDEGSAAGEAGS